MDELETIISSLCQSDYLSQWILRLQGNEVLFSPQINIRPCLRADDNAIRSNTWKGLSLLVSYCERGVVDVEVDAFIVSLLNESIAIYINDKETDPYKKLNSSSLILDVLLDIILARVDYFDKVDFESFVEVYLDGVTSWPFSLVYEMFQAKEMLVRANPRKVFNAYKRIMQSKQGKEDYEEYLIIEDLVTKNPQEYYAFAKEYILDTGIKKTYLDMGAFYEYSASHIHGEDLCYFRWLRVASQYMDTTTLRDDIGLFISSGAKILRKIGLCLININFEKLNDLFFNNLGLFFSRKEFYADLRCILQHRNTDVFVSANKDVLLKSLREATFGLEQGRTLSLLKNHLAMIYNANGFSVPFAEETPSDLEFILNFDKGIYFVRNPLMDDIEAIKSIIQNETIDEAVAAFSNFSKTSAFFSDAIFSAFRDYLVTNYPNDYWTYIGRFGPKFSSSILYYLSESSSTNHDTLLAAVQTIIELMRKGNAYLECLPALLFSVQKLSQVVDANALTGVVYAIDYRWITLEDFGSNGDLISVCINENLYSYLELLCYVSQANRCAKRAREAIDYYMQTNDCAKLKSILASVFPRLLFIDESYALSLNGYIFNNVVNGRNYSYPLLAVSSGINETLIGVISKNQNLPDFLSEKPSDGQDQMALTALSEWLFRFYVFKNEYKNLVTIQFLKNQYDIILESVKSMNYWLQSKTVSQEALNRYKEYLGFVLSAISADGYDFRETDQLLRAVAQTIILSDDFDDIAWDVLGGLSKHFRHYFSDDCVELIKRFKDIRVKEIHSLLSMYFSTYDPLLTYEKTLIEVYNLISNDDKYKRAAKEWKVSLLRKNTRLKPLLA